MGRLDLARRWVDYRHGTHVAGIAAGSGGASGGRYRGVAYEANLVSVRVSSVSEAIEGIRWVMGHRAEYGISVVNLSMGDVARGSCAQCTWCSTVEEAVQAGLVMVVAAGNDRRRLSTPGISPSAITVGGLDDRGTLDPSDDTPYGVLSLEGKPDVVAPAVDVISVFAPEMSDPDQVDDNYLKMVGTSMATPAVAGLCALLLQAQPSLGPARLKSILIESALICNGMRMIQADRALNLALEEGIR